MHTATLRRRLAAGIGALALLSVGTTAHALPDPVEPYIDKYGREICDGLTDHPEHAEILRAIATVRDYVHLSDEDAELVVVRSVEALCPQYVPLIDEGEPVQVAP